MSARFKDGTFTAVDNARKIGGDELIDGRTREIMGGVYKEDACAVDEPIEGTILLINGAKGVFGLLKGGKIGRVLSRGAGDFKGEGAFCFELFNEGAADPS